MTFKTKPRCDLQARNWTIAGRGADPYEADPYEAIKEMFERNGTELQAFLLVLGGWWMVDFWRWDWWSGFFRAIHDPVSASPLELSLVN